MKPRCDECGTELITDCRRCGAPNCCPACCKLTTEEIMSESTIDYTKPLQPRDYVAYCISQTLLYAHDSRRNEVASRIADIIETAAELGFDAAWQDARSLAEDAERGDFKEAKK